MLKQKHPEMKMCFKRLLSFSVFRGYSKMSPEQLDFLANDIQDILKRDLVLVKGCHPQGLPDAHRAKKVFAVKILCLLNITRLFILSFLCLFPSSKTSTYFRIVFVDTLFAFGSFGCICNQIFLLGWIFAFNFSYVMHEAEKNGQLHVVSHIKDHKKFRLTSVERKKFATYFKWIKTMRSLFIYMILPPVFLFVIVGAYLSSLELQSVNFTAASIFVTLMNCTQVYFGCIWTNYAYIMPVHSSNVLSTQLIRLLERMKRLQRAHNFMVANQKLEAETREQEVSFKIHQWVKRAQQQVKKRHEILTMIEDVLRQIELHNEAVKHILDKAISCIVPAVGLVIIFSAGERGTLLRYAFSAAVGLSSAVFYVSLLKTREVYTLSRRLSSSFHGIQVRLKGKGMKSQLQILRLIQKTSDCESWHHLIGFTVGNRGSLSPKLVLSSFFQTITIALTFLNARSAWRQH